MNVEHHLFNRERGNKMKAAVFVEPGKMEVREVARPGAVVGRVGVPHTGDINIGDYWMVNLAMAGGPASCTTYDKEILLKAVLDGQINPGKVFKARAKHISGSRSDWRGRRNRISCDGYKSR